MTPDNEIRIGDLDVKNYVGAVLHNMLPDGDDNDQAFIVSRGSNNSRALDVAEIVRRENDSIEIASIELGTHSFESDDDSLEDSRVTSVEIELVK